MKWNDDNNDKSQCVCVCDEHVLFACALMCASQWAKNVTEWLHHRKLKDASSFLGNTISELNEHHTI